MHFNRRKLIGLAVASLLACQGCVTKEFDTAVMKEHEEKLKKSGLFRYPLDDYFPETPVTTEAPPRGEKYHAAEDSFTPPGTPVYAIGDGIISYSGKARGYGWLIIIDHPTENVYSLYGHISTSRWKKGTGEVKKGELIAYIGEAEEGETMVSHIHFGMRLGQRADYPRWGDGRWMAGYTNRPPQRVGWFHPSKIICQTDSMRKWHRYIQKRKILLTGRSLKVGDFRISSAKYSEKEDLDEMIKNEFGDQYRLADWNEILTFRMNIEEWADSLGLKAGEENSLQISNDGYRIWLGRQYYISRFNHDKPGEYLAHDAINYHFVCLGSWYGLNMRVLAVRK